MTPQFSLILALLLLLVLEGWKGLACLPSLLVMLRSTSPSYPPSTSSLPDCSLASRWSSSSSSSNESSGAASSLW